MSWSRDPSPRLCNARKCCAIDPSRRLTCSSWNTSSPGSADHLLDAQGDHLAGQRTLRDEVCRTGLAVEPSSIAVKTVPDTTATAGVKVRNTAAADGDELSWTIHESAGSCATPSDVPWLEATVVGDTTTSGATSTRVRVLFNRDGLAPGLCP